MGAMPFSDFFKLRREEGQGDTFASTDARPISVSSEDKLDILRDLEASGQAWFWATDANGHLHYLSPTILAALGVSDDQLPNLALQQVFFPVEGDGNGRSLGLKLGTRKAFTNIAVCAGQGADAVVLRLSGRPLFDSEDRFLGFRGSGIDMTDEYRSQEEASRLAKFDSLTGLANRHCMEQRIDATLTAFRVAHRSCAVMMLDLDRFKKVNDTLGHAAGDHLLQQVAERLRSAVGGRGEIARLGGDEFQLLIPDIDDRGELGEIAKRVIQMVSQPYSLDEGRCVIGCSVGIAIAPYDGVERDELTRAADLALYASKNGGRAQFRFYAADLEYEANLRKRMEQDLAAAMDGNCFALEYLPVVSLANSHVVTLEVQYCWEDDERGRVSAATFLPVAESSRLIVRMGEWAVRRACRDACQWPESLRVAIAVTPVQFAADGFAEMIESALEDSGLDPARLTLELNEAVLLGEASMVDMTLATLFKLGVRLSLDQFGTGLSSISYLRRAPFTALKIGANFFEPVMGSEHGDMEMVRAVVALAGAMGMETAATGVHAIALMQQLKRQGIGHVQGYVFSDALTADQVLEHIAVGGWKLEPTDVGSQRASRRTVFRKIGLIHEDQYYDVTLRNLSRSGAMIQGLENVPVGTQFVLDFSGGQLAVCTVQRAMDDTQGVKFEQELVDDGAGGLCTRNRVSPYALAIAGAPLAALPAGKYSDLTGGGASGGSFSRFKLSSNAPRQSAVST